MRSLFLLVVVVLSLYPQEPRPRVGTGALSGTVVSDEATAVPIRRARVTLNSTAPVVALTTITDDAGRFSFDGLPAGAFLVAAVKPSFVSATYGASRPGRPGTPIALAGGQRLSNVVLKMLRGAVIEGSVVDQHGEPASNRTIVPRQFRLVNGQRTLAPVTVAGDARTDDRGKYRLFGLTPGDYLLSVEGGSVSSTPLRELLPSDVARATALGRGAQAPATLPSSPRTLGYVPIYFPGTSNAAQAGVVHVDAGQVRSDADIRWLPIAMTTVTARVTRADGPLPTSLNVRLTATGTAVSPVPGALGVGNEPSLRLTTPGTYSSLTVPPGQYRVIAEGRNLPARGAAPASSSDSGRQAWYAEADLLVGASGTTIDLALAPEPSVFGRVAFEGQSPRPPDLSKTWVNLVDIGTGHMWARAVVSADGAFTTDAVRPGLYLVGAEFPPNTPNAYAWSLKSAMLNGRDVADLPLELRVAEDVRDLVVTFTDKPTELSGKLEDAKGQAASDYYIVVFSLDRAMWFPQSRRIAQTRPSSDGRFSIKALPPGRYLLAALTDVEPGEWFDPAFLTALAPQALRIELAEGEKKTQDLRIR